MVSESRKLVGTALNRPTIVQPPLSNLFRRLHCPLAQVAPGRGPATMAEHDLTAKLAKSMDRHLVFPLLEWLSAKELYPEDQIQQGKLDLLNKTNMLDYAMEIYTQLNNRDPPQELKERRTEVVQNLRKLQVCDAAAAVPCKGH